METQPEAAGATSRRPAAMMDDSGAFPTHKKRNGTVIGLLLIAAGVIMGVVYLARRPAEQAALQPPAAETAAATAAAAAPGASPTESVTIAAPQGTPQVVATPAAAPKPLVGTLPPHATALRGAVPPRAVAPPATGVKLGAGAGQPAPTADAQAPKKTDTVKSAIDDRK